MSIDKDINQRKFRNEYQRAGINLIYTYNWANEQIKLLFDQFDITPQQFNILRILPGAGEPLPPPQPPKPMPEKRGNTSRIVDRLLKKGLVKKMTCKADRRLVDVTISDKGLKMLEKMDRHQDEFDGVFKNLSESEAKTLNKLLDKVRHSE